MVRGRTRRRTDRAVNPQQCPSTFDRWSCQLPDTHAGLHQGHCGTEQARWNDTAAGQSIKSIASKRVR